MIDTNQIINGCKVWLEHDDSDKAKSEAGNYKAYLASIDMKAKEDKV